MTRSCELTGKRPMAGNNVSHAKNRTKRRFIPNLRRVSWHGETLKAPLRLRVSASALRSVEHCGGIEAYLLKTPNACLSPKARHFKKRLLKSQEGKSGKGQKNQKSQKTKKPKTKN